MFKSFFKDLHALFEARPDEWDLRLRELMKYEQPLREFVDTHQFSSWLAEAGIPLEGGLLSSLSVRLLGKILPPPPRAGFGRDAIRSATAPRGDSPWMEEFQPDQLEGLAQTLAPIFAPSQRKLHNEVAVALDMVSHRLAALGLETELVRNSPTLSRYENPFLGQAREVRELLSDFENGRDLDNSQLRVLLAQCREVATRVRGHAQSNGTSLHLTYLLITLDYTLERVSDLSDLLCGKLTPAQTIAFALRLCRAESSSNSLRELARRNLSVMALRITEQSGNRGRHYIAENRQELRHLFLAAAGAGCIVAVMALIKLLIALLHLPLLLQAALYSFNYGFGFVLVHMLGFTIATKQPAMTAATLAECLCEDWRAKTVRMDRVADECRKTLRSQMVAILGNVALALPAAYLLSALWAGEFGISVAPLSKAQHIFHDQDPFHSLAIVHAGIAGVGLFLSGIVSSLIDNQTDYFQIPARLRHSPVLRKLLGRRREVWAQSMEHNSGPIAGNLFLGAWLGVMAPLGEALGLPLDIRHITFSAANLGYALHRYVPSLEVILNCVAGLALIGFVNLALSFGLAVWVAMRSRGLDSTTMFGLARLVLRRVREQVREEREHARELREQAREELEREKALAAAALLAEDGSSR